MNISIRASMLPSYCDCPRRAACKMIPDLLEKAGFVVAPRPPIVAAAIGTAVHQGESECMKAKLTMGEVCSEGQAVDSAVSNLDEALKEETSFDAKAPDKPTAEKQVIRLTGSYYKHAQPRIQPAKIWDPKDPKDKISADVGDGFTVTGHPDVQTVEHCISDLKTGAILRPPQAQLGTYSMVSKSNSVDIQGVQAVFVPRVSIKKEQPESLFTVYDLAQCEIEAWSIINRVKADVQAFLEKGDPRVFLANPMSMLCSEKFCPAVGIKGYCEFRAKA